MPFMVRPYRPFPVPCAVITLGHFPDGSCYLQQMGSSDNPLRGQH